MSMWQCWLMWHILRIESWSRCCILTVYLVANARCRIFISVLKYFLCNNTNGEGALQCVSLRSNTAIYITYTSWNRQCRMFIKILQGHEFCILTLKSGWACTRFSFFDSAHTCMYMIPGANQWPYYPAFYEPLFFCITSISLCYTVCTMQYCVYFIQ